MRQMNYKNNVLILIAVSVIYFLAFESAFALGLEQEIKGAIDDLVRILNIVIVGFIAWAGFLIAKGESFGYSRLIYGVIGLLVVNGANLIINYFK